LPYMRPALSRCKPHVLGIFGIISASFTAMPTFASPLLVLNIACLAVFSEARTCGEGYGDLTRNVNAAAECHGCFGSDAQLVFDSSMADGVGQTKCKSVIASTMSLASRPQDNTADQTTSTACGEGYGDQRKLETAAAECTACKGSDAQLVFVSGIADGIGFTECKHVAAEELVVSVGIYLTSSDSVATETIVLSERQRPEEFAQPLAARPADDRKESGADSEVEGAMTTSFSLDFSAASVSCLIFVFCLHLFLLKIIGRFIRSPAEKTEDGVQLDEPVLSAITKAMGTMLCKKAQPEDDKLFLEV